MKKRFTAFSLTFVMLIGQIFGSGMTVLAENGGNAYGHTVTYKPVTQLYTAGEPVRFFDAQITDWGTLSEKITRDEANSIKWLSENGYLLNHFGRKIEASGDNTNRYTDGCFNSKGEWQTKLQGPNQTGNGQNYTSVDLADLFYPKPDNGNIYNMYDKGDLQYFFSWKVKTVRTSWALTGTSNDYGDTYALRGWTRSIGGGWMKYNTLGDGPNFYDSTAWKPGKKSGWYISFVGMSDKDKRVDSYLSGAMLVGRDIKGPSISSVRVTSDIEGNNEIENGAITLDTIDDLDNRTVYFQVEWDEPVAFQGMTEEEIAKLSLNVETIGIDGTSGIIAEAPFLKFAPSKNDAKPVMVFEYQIADPYTDSSAVVQERGYFYKFSKVTVSEKENSKLWDHIYDISGNKFAADENGSQPASKVVAPVSGSPYVDLLPFGIENIRMTKDENDGNAFVKAGGLLVVTLELNKAAKSDTKVMDLPVITLNIKDESGQYITIRPNEDDLRRKYRFRDGWSEAGYFYGNSGRLQPVMLSADKKSIEYYVQLIPGYSMDGDSIKVIAVSSDKEKLKDASGYGFMDYELVNNMLTPTDIPSGAESKTSTYSVSPDKQYRIDFEEPIITLSAHDEGEGIILITASIDDNSIEGCDVAFSATVNGSIADGQSLCYQVSSGENYDNTKWIAGETGTMTAAFGAPVINGKAYGFIKLPQNSETDKITISAVVVDEAENSASIQTEFSLDFDTLAPTVNLSVKDEIISVDITDMADDVTYSYGFSEDETDAPSYTEGQGKIGTISAPDDFPEGENKVYTRVLWITARDSHGNESEIIKLPVEYDRTYTDIIVTSADTSKQYLTGEYPIVYFNIKNAKAYWCTWAEKPANTADTAAYIVEKCLDDMKTRAETYGITFNSDDGSITDFTNRLSMLDSSTHVAVIDPATELYVENIYTDETSRPLMLVIGAEREDGTTLVKTVEFDTFYGAPKAGVIQNRFSTNDSNGNRADYINGADTARLLLASDTEYTYPLNTPSLYGFAQAEFKLAGDPVTGLDRVDVENSSITLEKVVYGGTDLSGEEKSREVVKEWSFSDIGLNDASKSAIVDIDPKSIEAKYYEVDENGNRNAVRYEFSANMSYKGGVEAKKIPITYFAFNNEPSAFICDIPYEIDGWFSLADFENYEKKNVEAVFDEDGNDITSNIPVYTTAIYEVGSDPGVYVRFSANGLSDEDDSDTAYYNAPVINATETDNAAKMTMRIGTDPKNLSDVIPFTYLSYRGIMSGCYDIEQYLSGDESELCEVKLYYSFEYPERGTASPIYVLKIRRDNVEPVFDISVSETERATNEVLVKLNSVYDVQKAADGTVVIDTSEEDLLAGRYFSFDALREAAEDEDLSEIPEENIMYGEYYDEQTDSYISKIYVKIQPDNDGIYHFTSNGFIEMFAEDNVGNRASTALINGETVSATVAANGDLPNGASLYAKEKLVMFTTESDSERTVSLTLTGTGGGNSETASVVLSANTIDLTAPTGTVYYKADGNNIKANLVTGDTDLAENGVYVTGTRANGTAFELKYDENGYYTEFDTNGTGRFVLLDKAGNTGTVAIAVLAIDNEPPKNLSEGWQSVVSAKTQEEIKKLLETPTNSTIKLFITFNEQLSGAKVKAYETGDDTKELTPTEDYVTATVSGNAITVEFIGNCRAMLTVYDLRGNALVLWRPEDGPITVIDRDVPKLLENYPKRTVIINKVTLQYIFADGEEVMLLQDNNSGYRNEHIVTFSDNGTKILNFADKAGNVFSDYPVITEVDILAPNIKMSTDFVGEGAVLSGNDSYKAGNLYTSKNVRILLNVEDATPDGITVTARTKSGAEIEVKKENVTVNEKSYNYNFTVSENGSYTVTAKDKWGNENSVEASVSVIDKTPPTIKFIANTAVVKVGASEAEAKNKIMENIAATDLQSGANSPMGDYFGEVADGVALNVDLSKIKLDKPGKYAAKITATDRLGNYAEKDYTVNVVRDVYTFKVNGSSVYANDVYTASKGKITIESANETAKYYYAQGYKTAADRQRKLGRIR